MIRRIMQARATYKLMKQSFYCVSYTKLFGFDHTSMQKIQTFLHRKCVALQTKSTTYVLAPY